MSKNSQITTLLTIASHFHPGVTEISPLGNGLINDTFLVLTKSSSFVLQRINRQVFPRPELIMENLKSLNQHIEKKFSTSVKLQIPCILSTQQAETCFYDEKSDCWRALSYIANTESLEKLVDTRDAEQVGFALGHFHRLISDLDPLSLHDTLPGFHIAPGYLEHYQHAFKQSPPISALPESRYCAEFISSFQYLTDNLETAKQQGLLPLRVIHGDPKLNNFLFDKHSRKIVSIIDLDTVKPGLIHYDIGDCLRSCCHNVETKTFDLAICAHLLKAYLSEAGAFFSDADYHFLYPAIELIPFELGLRFYTDYLEGNRYFKVAEPLENLQRACSQFHLCESIMAQKNDIQHLIEALTSKTILWNN
jgi:Ser/Thr protein kinase RdoA (MazF antagonist)